MEPNHWEATGRVQQSVTENASQVIFLCCRKVYDVQDPILRDPHICESNRMGGLRALKNVPEQYIQASKGPGEETKAKEDSTNNNESESSKKEGNNLRYKTSNNKYLGHNIIGDETIIYECQECRILGHDDLHYLHGCFTISQPQIDADLRVEEYHQHRMLMRREEDEGEKEWEGSVGANQSDIAYPMSLPMGIERRWKPHQVEITNMKYITLNNIDLPNSTIVTYSESSGNEVIERISINSDESQTTGLTNKQAQIININQLVNEWAKAQRQRVNGEGTGSVSTATYGQLFDLETMKWYEPEFPGGKGKITRNITGKFPYSERALHALTRMGNPTDSKERERFQLPPRLIVPRLDTDIEYLLLREDEDKIIWQRKRARNLLTIQDPERENDTDSDKDIEGVSRDYMLMGIGQNEVKRQLRKLAHNETNMCLINQQGWIVDNGASENFGKRNETILMSTNVKSLYSDAIWMADSGASTHITNSLTGTTPSKGAVEKLRGMKSTYEASGNKIKITAIVDVKGLKYSKRGDPEFSLTMENCRYGGSKFNLCSLAKMIHLGWKMTGDKTGIKLTKGSHEIHFDIPVKTSEGNLWAMYLQRRNNNGEYIMATPSTMSVQQAHAYCGHNNERRTRKIANYNGWKLTKRPFIRCEPCAIGKARQKNLGRGESNPPKKIGQLWYIDGMRLKRPKKGKDSFPSNNCLVMAVEHLSGATMIGWYAKKNGFIQEFCAKFYALNENSQKVIERMRCDDAGENYKLQEAINGKDWKMAVKFEFTAKTPQMNSRVETKLYNMSCLTRSAMAAANIPDKLRYVVFTLFYKWCCQTDMLTLITVNDEEKSRHEHITGEQPKWIKNMQVAGMAGMVKTHTKTTAKVKPRGKICMFACYTTNHARDCYTMYDPILKTTIKSRDVLWLNRMYYDKKKQGIGQDILIEGLTTEQDIIEATDEGSVVDDESTAASSEDTTSETSDEQNDDEDNNSNGSSNDDDDDDNYDHQQEEEEESNRQQEEEEDSDHQQEEEEESDDGTEHQTTRSGRVSRRPKAHDGTEYGGIAAMFDEEIAALAIQIEEQYVELSYEEGEYNLATPSFESNSMDEEDYILYSLAGQSKDDIVYKSVEQAYGFINYSDEYMMAAATLQDMKGEYYLVGATGHNYGNTKELQTINYKQAMASLDKIEWEKAIKVEHKKMLKFNVFEVVHPRDVPDHAKLFTSTWAMKKKPDGTYRARNAIRGYEQVNGVHFDEHDKSSPVATEVAIRIVFVLVIMAGWYQHLLDVEGAFLHGHFEHPDKHKMYTKVPEAYKKWYPSWAIFQLLRTQYGTVQAALQYYRECCKALAFIRFSRNRAEPCVFFKWEEGYLVIFLIWVDDCCISGHKHIVEKVVKKFTGMFDCKDLGELTEYVGCKVERTRRWIRLTQPVKVQRFIDEFNCIGDGGPNHRAPTTPAQPGSVLQFDKDKQVALSDQRQSTYRSGVGILLHMMRWSRPDTLNAVRETSCFMQKAGEDCKKALKRIMNYIVSTKKKGYTFRPRHPNSWDGGRNKWFEIMGKADSEFAKHDTRRSVNGGITYLERAIVKQFSKMMPIVALSTTEAETYSAVMTAQDMMFVYHVMRHLGLKVTLPMILYCDNKGAVDLANNWSVGGRTRHMDVKQNFLRELKENGFILVKWRSGEDMTPDMHTKNVTKSLFDRYSQELVS